MKNFEHVAARVRKYREDRAWTQEQLARVAKITPRTVQRVEAGESLSAHTLQRLADSFEIDVAMLRAPPAGRRQEQKVCFLIRITTGSDLGKVIGGACAYLYDNPEPRDDDEMKLISGFLQDVHDYGDIWGELEPAQQVEAAHAMTSAIRELEEAGLWVFVAQRQETYRVPAAEGGHAKMTWPVAIVTVQRRDDPAIIRVGDGRMETIPAVVKGGWSRSAERIQLSDRIPCDQ